MQNNSNLLSDANSCIHSRFASHQPIATHLLQIGYTILLCSTLCACSSQRRTQVNPQPTTAAMINGQPITNAQLWPLLAEIAGDQTLQELTLTKLLDQLALKNNWTITNSDLDHELIALTTTIAQTSDSASTPKLIETIRRRRGLGPARFDALLRRNAILRKAIPPRNTPSVQTAIQNEIDAAFDLFRGQNGSEPTDSQQDQIKIRSALAVEQRAMEALAVQLLESAEVIVMDRSIKWSRLGGE